ncbi:MAG: tyrosine--tRNA ligase, partial [Flavobacteriales bacterium]
WRGMLHDSTPGAEELLEKHRRVGYIGIDPTADSLHIGHLASLMILTHFQRHGHQPIALVGGATGMIGDPSGRSEERNLLSEEALERNKSGLKTQLENFLDFEASDNPARLLDNYDWFKDMSFLSFIRDVGKHITVSYMMSKESVQKRLDAGMSFTEFSYQLAQGYDFLHLYREMDCRFQMGGSDQWGNITTGTELIRRIEGGEAHALTSPLITRADGGKFGKTEKGTVWLDPNRTSPYEFYQFWLNVSDEDAPRFLRIFTLKEKEEIEKLEKEHAEAPHQRIMQQELAKEVTTRVHSEEAYENAVKASKILFGKSTKEDLSSLSLDQALEVFEGVPRTELSKKELEQGIDIATFLSESTGFMGSKGEAKRALKEGSIKINKEKVEGPDRVIDSSDLIDETFILGQKGKKNYFLVLEKEKMEEIRGLPNKFENSGP